MILIRHIDYLEVPNDPFTLFKTLHPYETTLVTSDAGPTQVQQREVQELIKGRYYTRPDGSTILLGLANQAEEVIGIQYEAWGAMEKEMTSTFTLLLKEQKKVRDLKSAPFWTRLIWLITGKFPSK